MRAHAARRIDRPFEEMTCAKGATRIETRLNKLPGVEASVCVAAERASVTFDPAAVGSESLGEAVEHAGYPTTLPPAGTPSPV